MASVCMKDGILNEAVSPPKEESSAVVEQKPTEAVRDPEKVEIVESDRGGWGNKIEFIFGHSWFRCRTWKCLEISLPLPEKRRRYLHM